jgi:1-acyl-sn-glycerol-3-phosphate acyltransferase
MTYIVGMCVALPATLLPQRLLYKAGFISRQEKEQTAVRTGCFCARWMLRMVPFCQLHVKNNNIESDSMLATNNDESLQKQQRPDPSIWVCNHTSMLDIFLLLAADKRLRGRFRRPIKIVYWKQLEDNPITRLLFRQAGFISVDMQANGSGNDNSYDKSTFKQLLKDCKQAFAEGFDIGLLPEGQLNPTPEKGLLPIFSGAYTLAKMSRRPIQFLAMHGAHKLWCGDDILGTTMVTDRNVTVRCYPNGRMYTNADEFRATFSAVVGNFGATGTDLAPARELQGWLMGTRWCESDKEVETSGGF